MQLTQHSNMLLKAILGPKKVVFYGTGKKGIIKRTRMLNAGSVNNQMCNNGEYTRGEKSSRKVPKNKNKLLRLTISEEKGDIPLASVLISKFQDFFGTLQGGDLNCERPKNKQVI